MSIENTNDRTNDHKSIEPQNKDRVADVHRYMKIYTYLQGLDNPPKTSKAMVKAATRIDEALKAFEACEDEGLSFREVSVGLHDLRFEMKALNNFVNRWVKPIG